MSTSFTGTLSAIERASIVRFARRYVGVPYSYGGTSPASGFDCSGFTRFVYAHFGIALPALLGRPVRSRTPGLARRLFARATSSSSTALGHVGLYIGHGLFIHAPHSGTRVSIDSLAGWYAGSYDGARSLL